MPGGPPRLPLSSEEGAAAAWPDPASLPPITTGAVRPAVGPRVVIPILAALVIAAGLSVVPWHRDGSGWFTVATYFATHGAVDFGDLYATYLAAPIALMAVLAGFAGALDSRPLRWLQFLLGGAALAIGASFAWRDVPGLLVPLAAVVVLVALGSAVIAFLKRVALRVGAACLLVGCALLHAGVLVTWVAPWLVAYAYLPVVGYVIGAVGAAIGPRYVPADRPL